MANKVYVGQEGAQELYRRAKALIPAVDQELDENSSNPISNSAVTNAFKKFGGYRKVNGTGADNHPDVQNPDPKVIYLVEDPNAPDPDHFYEWIWDVPTEGNPIWRCIGTATMDLEDYYTKDESDAIFATKDDLPTIDEHYAPDSSNAQSGIGVTEAVAGKADVSTTLAGYGISDAYTKTQVDALLADKADIISDGTENNLISLANDGNIKDSGIPSRTTAEGTSTLTITNTTVNNETTTTYGWGGWTDTTVSVPKNKVEIGGRLYDYVQIGNQLWLAENLQFRWSGLSDTISSNESDHTPWGVYYANNAELYGEYGLLYNGYALRYLAENASTLLPQGWQVPYNGHFTALLDYLGGVSIAGKKLKSTAYNGTDEYGFELMISGYCKGPGYSEPFYGFGTAMQLWSATTNGSNQYAYSFYPSTDNVVQYNGERVYQARYIRLVKTLA